MVSSQGSTLQPPNQPDPASVEVAFGEPFPQPRNIDITFFSYKSRRSTLLVGNQSADNFVRARRHWLDFDFVDLVYVTEINVYATGYENYHGMELSLIPYLSDQGERKLTTNFSGDHFSFQVRDFTKGFGLRPNEPLFRSAQIERVEVLGVEKHYVAEFVQFVDNIEAKREAAKADLSVYFTKANKSYEEFLAREEEIRELEATLEEKSNELKDLEGSTEIALQTNKKTQEDIQVAATVAKEQAARADNLEQSIDKLTEERRVLTKAIVDSEGQLAEIKANINLFPTDLNGYVRQGTRSIRLYAALCIVPLVLIVWVTLRLFGNSERLLDAIALLKDISIFDFLLSRLPYVTVSLTVLGISVGVLRFLLSEIIEINRRRQELYKISIVAQDVSYASQDGLDLSVDDEYDLRTQTKMELLKEHLRQNVGDEYVYSPRRTFLEHLKRFPKKLTPPQLPPPINDGEAS
ncbi:hypothetical protein [Mesorhizobium sp. M0488]|uniref:hypothetical protein n=1 Tax=unclassified Mesorhizobium TaxID=325217 RepID=UPI003339BEE9